MKNVIHFNSSAERIAFLKGKLHEVKPKKAENVKTEHFNSENEKKSQKKKAKDKKDD